MNKLQTSANLLLSKIKISINGFQKRYGWTPLLLLILFVLSLALRHVFIGFTSGDYDWFLSPWYTFIKEHGGFFALKERFADYNMPYLYLLAMATYLPLEKIVSIKLISIVFDYILAGAAFFTILRITSSHIKAAFAFFAILFLPTVILNGVLWGQCDVIYTAFAVMSIAALITSRPRTACILFGVALAFKLQAIFIAPLFLVLFLQKKISFQNLLWIPAMLLIALIPAVAVGKPIKDALIIYVQQAGTYKFLTMNAPNFYQWLPNNYFEIFNKAGLIFAVTITIGFVVLLYVRKDKTDSSSSDVLLLATFFALLVPFILPTMHERYFFLADILALLLAISRPKLWLVPVLIILTSFFSYLPFLFGTEPIPLRILPFALIVALAILIRKIFFTKKA
jgi:Gpi18-like mannosyltransferase